jgi:hypothetical protein
MEPRTPGYHASANDLISDGVQLYKTTEVDRDEVRMVPVAVLLRRQGYAVEGPLLAVSRHLVEDDQLFHYIESLGRLDAV